MAKCNQLTPLSFKWLSVQGSIITEMLNFTGVVLVWFASKMACTVGILVF